MLIYSKARIKPRKNFLARYIESSHSEIRGDLIHHTLISCAALVQSSKVPLLKRFADESGKLALVHQAATRGWGGSLGVREKKKNIYISVIRSLSRKLQRLTFLRASNFPAAVTEVRARARDFLSSRGERERGGNFIIRTAGDDSVYFSLYLIKITRA